MEPIHKWQTVALHYTKGGRGRIALRIRGLTGQRLKMVWPGRCGIFIETYKPKTEGCPKEAL